MKIENFHIKEILDFLKPENQKVFLELNLKEKQEQI